MSKTIVVASQNPVKVQSVERAFKRCFPDEALTVKGVSVPSGVNAQPMTADETLTGATNRAQNAKAAVPEADFWVGLEGGLEQVCGRVFTFGWVFIIAKSGRMRFIFSANLIVLACMR